MNETDARADAKRRGDTSVALIEAAERLFGQQGIENVSLRQVRIEAGAANNSAIAYHFKDREDCGSAWKKDPGSGVIGVEKGPLIPVV